MERTNLAAARYEKGWSQEEVAERVGVTRNTLSKWERGVVTPYPLHIYRLCEVYGKSALELDLVYKGRKPFQTEELQITQEAFPKSNSASTITQDDPCSPPLSTATSHSSLSPGTESLKNIRHKVSPTRREVLELVGTSAISLAAPEIFGTETLQEFARVLNKPSVLEKHHLSLLEERTALLWKYRDDGILSPHELCATVDRHFQQIVRLLDGSLLPSTRTQLLSVASKTVTLNGALFYDLAMYEQAKEHHRLAVQAAAQAAQPILQAIAYAWMSFSWTYERRYLEASHAIAQAISLLTDLNEDRKTFAWLTAVAAEISANLGNYDECTSFLEQAKSSLEASFDQRHVYLHQFSNAQFRGFRGVCYQVLYHPKKPETHRLLEQARTALEQALLDFLCFYTAKATLPCRSC